MHEVPVVVRDLPADRYAQVAENQKRHGLTPLELAGFIRAQADAGDSNATIAKQLGMNLTAAAHHLSLLDLPPVLDDALKSGRCTSPRTLHELRKLHADSPSHVQALLASGAEITRATAAIRSASDEVAATEPVESPPDKLIAQANAACDRLARALSRIKLSDASPVAMPDLMVLHTHQANPHVHISVRAEGRDGKRLNPRKEDLHRWRETFAEKLRDWGIEAEASSPATRGVSRRSLRGWERLRGATARTGKKRGEHKSRSAFRATRSGAMRAWAEITKALAASPDPSDRKLSRSIVDFVMQTEVARAVQRHRAAQRQAELPGMTREPSRTVQQVRPEPSRGPDMSR